MKRIALYGGSFNPPTIAHRNIGLALLAQLPVDEVWYLVSPQNPFKSTVGMAPFDERVTMARLNVADNPRLVVQDIEAAYLAETNASEMQTADTLRLLQRDFPDHQFIWAMGADNLHHFHLWDDADFITDNFPIVIIPRKNYTDGALQSVTARKLALAASEITGSRAVPGELYLLKIKETAIAATKCRKGLAEGRAPRALRSAVARRALQKNTYALGEK